MTAQTTTPAWTRATVTGEWGMAQGEGSAATCMSRPTTGVLSRRAAYLAYTACSGGPVLLKPTKDAIRPTTLVGITSFGPDCGSERWGAYTGETVAATQHSAACQWECA